MIKQYSVAEAQNHFVAIVQGLKPGHPVTITSLGAPVAVLLTVDEYERLIAKKVGFGDDYQSFRESFDLTQLNIAPDNFADARDHSLGRASIL